ncbi:MAG: hypothetical protein ABR910_13265 [Acidobacteriaceae bacterium]
MLRISQRLPGPVVIAVAAILCGCGAGEPGSSPGTVARAGVRGAVMGGQQPVSGSTLQLYAVGTGGDESARRRCSRRRR